MALTTEDVLFMRPKYDYPQTTFSFLGTAMTYSNFAGVRNL